MHMHIVDQAIEDEGSCVCFGNYYQTTGTALYGKAHVSDIFYTVKVKVIIVIIFESLFTVNS